MSARCCWRRWMTSAWRHVRACRSSLTVTVIATVTASRHSSTALTASTHLLLLLLMMVVVLVVTLRRSAMTTQDDPRRLHGAHSARWCTLTARVTTTATRPSVCGTVVTASARRLGRLSLLPCLLFLVDSLFVCWLVFFCVGLQYDTICKYLTRVENWW